MIKTLLVCMICAVMALGAGPLTLHQAQQQLLEENLTIRGAQLAVDQANGAVREARSTLYPSLDASAAYSYTTKQGTITIDPQTFFPLSPTSSVSVPGAPKSRTDLGIDLSYPLFTGLSRIYALEAAEQGAARQKQSLEALRNRLSFSLGMLYLQWNLSYKQESLRRSWVEELESQSMQMKNLFAGGVVAKARVLETDARLQSAKTDLLAAIDLSDSLKREVMNFIQSRDSTIVPQDTLFPFDLIAISGAVDTARAEVKALERSSDQLEFTGKVLKGQRLPSLFATAGYRYANPGLDVGTDKFMNYGLIGVQAKWNIFDGFKTKEELAQLKIEQDIIENSKHDLLVSFEKELDLSAAQIRSATARIDAAMLSLQSAQAYEEELHNSLDAGVATRTDYLNAMNAREQAQLTIEQARFARRIAILNAFYASGQPISF